MPSSHADRKGINYCTRTPGNIETRVLYSPRPVAHMLCGIWHRRWRAPRLPSKWTGQGRRRKRRDSTRRDSITVQAAHRHPHPTARTPAGGASGGVDSVTLRLPFLRGNAREN